MGISRPLMIICAFLFAFSLVIHAKNGEHNGEVKQLFVDITFSLASGQTITDANGIHYIVNGYASDEDKVYPSQYWGTYPLYFFGRKVGVLVTATNFGPREVTKIKIITEAYVLTTDGSNGGQLAPTNEIEVEIKKGQTKAIDASFVAESTSDTDSGLDRFIVKILHPNEGGGPGNAEPGLIMVKEGVFCPPKFQR